MVATLRGSALTIARLDMAGVHEINRVEDVEEFAWLDAHTVIACSGRAGDISTSRSRNPQSGARVPEVMRRPGIGFAAIAIILGAPSVALARDHLELVCSGVAKPKDGGDRIPLFFHLFESRANDGESRDEWLSTIYQGQLFQAHHLNKGDASPRAIELSHDGRIRFKGTYIFDNKLGSAPFTLHVVGKVNDDPTAAKKVYRDVDQTLACVDLSI